MDPNDFNIDPNALNIPPDVLQIVNGIVLDILHPQPQPQRRRQNLNHRPRTYVERNREEGHARLFNDYFSEHPVYTEEQFRRRFRMRKHVFLRIVEALGNHDDYFQQRIDAVGRMGLSPLQKCTAAIRMLAYGSPGDAVDEYVRIGETTAIECLERFVKGVVEIFGPEYLRRPNNEDIQRLLQIGEARGFPGSNNDINVLNQSDVFNDVLQGNAPQNGLHLLKASQGRETTKKKLFARHQEAARKDVERAFGVLQSRFSIVRGPGRFWHIEALNNIIYACVTLHNMIVEDERHAYDQSSSEIPPVDRNSEPHPSFQAYIQRRATMRDRNRHHQLQADLVEHIWNRFGHTFDED